MLARQAQPSTGRLAPRLGEYLQASTEARFKSQTGPDGRPWAPLKYLGISPADDAEIRAIIRRGWSNVAGGARSEPTGQIAHSFARVALPIATILQWLCKERARQHGGNAERWREASEARQRLAAASFTTRPYA